MFDIDLETGDRIGIARIQIGARLNPPSLKEALVASLQQRKAT